MGSLFGEARDILRNLLRVAAVRPFLKHKKGLIHAPHQDSRRCRTLREGLGAGPPRHPPARLAADGRHLRRSVDGHRRCGNAGHSYDRRGFGRSEQPFNGYDYNTLADDLADVIAATGANDATILGFSMGGGEVARYMSRHGGANLRSAILVASVVPYMLQTEDNPNGTPQATFDEMTEGMTEDRPTSSQASSRISTASACSTRRSAQRSWTGPCVRR